MADYTINIAGTVTDPASGASGTFSTSALMTGGTTPPVDPPPIDPPPTGTGDDGSAGAPSGTPQYPTILNKYQYKPSWKVAGVHYPVGPAITTFKDPSKTPAPNGWRFNVGGRSAQPTTNGATLDGFDMRDWQIYADNQSDPIIKNCKLLVRDQVPIRLLGPANGYTGQGARIENCIIDGAGVNLGGQANMMLRGGNNIMRYCLVTRAGADLIAAGAEKDSGTTWDIQFCVIEEAGQADGGGQDLHPDMLQTFGYGSHYKSFIFNYNLVKQGPFPRGGGSQGITLDGNTNGPPACLFENGSVCNNTWLLTPAVGSLGFAMRLCAENTSGTWKVYDNFCDPSGLPKPYVNYFVRGSVDPNGGQHGTIDKQRNINMLDGSTL